jgi:tetratricopeptide (TPR) repeat protein
MTSRRQALHLCSPLLATLLLSSWGTAAWSQTQELTLDGQEWATTAEPLPGSDEAVMAQVRQLIVDGRPGQAYKQIDDWLDANQATRNPLLARAYLLRGDARTARGNEFKALYDYETVINDFPSDSAFVDALERELDIGKQYLHGLRRKWLGIRIESAKPLGTELLMRVQERLPGSKLAEEAAIELADFFYREGELDLAAQMYDILLRNFPQTRHRQHAMERRIFSNVGQFKGPRYSASGLVEARALIDDYVSRFPAEASQSGIGDALAARIDDSAAAQMLTTARWYLKRNDPVSARLTLNRLLLKHPNTASTDVAIDLMNQYGWIEDLSGRVSDENAGPGLLDLGGYSDGQAQDESVTPAEAAQGIGSAEVTETETVSPQISGAQTSPAGEEQPGSQNQPSRGVRQMQPVGTP